MKILNEKMNEKKKKKKNGFVVKFNLHSWDWHLKILSKYQVGKSMKHIPWKREADSKDWESLITIDFYQ